MVEDWFWLREGLIGVGGNDNETCVELCKMLGVDSGLISAFEETSRPAMIYAPTLPATLDVVKKPYVVAAPEVVSTAVAAADVRSSPAMTYAAMPSVPEVDDKVVEGGSGF